MKVRTPATIEDLYRVEGKAELVDGEIVPMSPTGYWPARAGARILLSLIQFEEESQLGRALPDNTGFMVKLPRRKSLSPDVAFFTGRIPDGSSLRYLDGAPVFAVEVRSENDYGSKAEREMASKRDDYFAAGTQVVWDVDLLSKDVVRVYRAARPGEPAIYRKGDMAEAEPALPGWNMPVDDLFR
jgi:Uma2 family endonuclease